MPRLYKNLNIDPGLFYLPGEEESLEAEDPQIVIEEPSRQPRRRRHRRRRRRSYLPLPVKTHGALFDDLEPIPTDPSIDPAPRNCFNCWQFNHEFKSCSRPRVAIFCYNCGRRGVDVSSCPRCSLAYHQRLQDSSEVINEETEVTQYEALAEDDDKEETGSLGCEVFVDQLSRVMELMADLPIGTRNLVVKHIMLERRMSIWRKIRDCAEPLDVKELE